MRLEKKENHRQPLTLRISRRADDAVYLAIDSLRIQTVAGFDLDRIWIGLFVYLNYLNNYIFSTCILIVDTYLLYGNHCTLVIVFYFAGSSLQIVTCVCAHVCVYFTLV